MGFKRTKCYYLSSQSIKDDIPLQPTVALSSFCEIAMLVFRSIFLMKTMIDANLFSE